MKNTIVLSLVCISLGFAAGWIAKPTPEATTAALAPTSSKPESRRATPRSDSSATESDRKKSAVTSLTASGPNQPKDLSPEMQKAIEDQQSKWGDLMKKRQMDKIDARIAKLTTELNLTPTQQTELRKILESKLTGLDSMFTGDISKSGDLASLLRGDGIDKALEDLLTPEQSEIHDALKTRELANQIESKALKNLAKISFLDLSQEQKDAAYSILYAEAEKTAQNPSAENSMMSVMTEGFGFDIDIEDLGMNFSTTSSDANGNPADMMAKVKENMAKRVDEKVEALRPVLNETQLEQYRKNLESKSGGMLGSMMGGFEAESKIETE